ncbi:MAG: hypothetical protein JRI86_00755 [Deltaproteobacteria bacterium]|nr:hypothetical protein [Deltaproteobacteria bacterium]
MNIEGDVVLVYFQEKPVFYARIESIMPDMKKNWYQVSLLLLTIPSQSVTWILKEEYINGASFTMGGNSVKLEEVKGILPLDEDKKDDDGQGKTKEHRPAKVIPFRPADEKK